MQHASGGTSANAYYGALHKLHGECSFDVPTLLWHYYRLTELLESCTEPTEVMLTHNDVTKQIDISGEAVELVSLDELYKHAEETGLTVSEDGFRYPMDRFEDHTFIRGNVTCKYCHVPVKLILVVSLDEFRSITGMKQMTDEHCLGMVYSDSVLPHLLYRCESPLQPQHKKKKNARKR